MKWTLGLIWTSLPFVTSLQRFLILGEYQDHQWLLTEFNFHYSTWQSPSTGQLWPASQLKDLQPVSDAHSGSSEQWKAVISHGPALTHHHSKNGNNPVSWALNFDGLKHDRQSLLPCSMKAALNFLWDETRSPHLSIDHLVGLLLVSERPSLRI